MNDKKQDEASNKNDPIESKGTRSKLTLKLKVPAKPAIPAPESKNLSTKSESRRISNSLVQVTIKSRKRENPNLKSEVTKELNLSEFEARKRAIIENHNRDGLDFADTKDSLLSKIGIKSLSTKDQSNVDFVSEDKSSKPNQISKEAEDVKFEDAEVSKNTPNYSQQVDDGSNFEHPESKILSNEKDFDIRNKIKKSIEIDNQKRIEREKLIANRKQIEQEKIEKEKKGKIKKKSKSDEGNDFDDDVELKSNKKNRSLNKNEKVSNRRSLKTFIVDLDEDDSYGSYRKKRKLKEYSEPIKDYKKVTKEVILPEFIIISELADRMSEKTGDIVKKLFTMGMVATSNQVIDADTAELIISEFGHIAKRVTESDVENILNDDQNLPTLDRAPIVTIMGHVDHGKTSLLDAIRSTNVVSGESGGITQHIGASRIKTNSGKFITFLDTPGHEAFTEMRSRGANVTDIVVLVVAADDGVKEQTVEAINHAKAAGVPIIVAVNKIDKSGADPSRVKNELLNYEIVAEDLSGDTMFVEVSAKQKLNLDKLEDAILLQAEVLELKAPYEGMARGVVIESRIDQNKGVVATLLVQKGILNVSDLVVAGMSYGKVRKMMDDAGKILKEATPSMPVEIMGLDVAPNAGDLFFEVKEEKQARDIIFYRSKKERDAKSLRNTVKSVSDIFKDVGLRGLKYLPIIIKADVNGSVEAICGSLLKLNNDEVAIKIIHSATGGITESDIALASVSGSMIIGFNVRANSAARDLAKARNIDIRYHSIIYNVVDELKLVLGGMLVPIKNEEYRGQAEVRQIFKISGIGKIAGCNVIDGLIKRGSRVRLLRSNIVIYDGNLKTLKRFKEDVKEVKSGFECGIAFDNYDDLKEGDVIECYDIVEQKRSL